MPVEVTLLSAFLIGLFGSTHCAGMCGGVMGAFTLGVRGTNATAPSLLPYLLAYNVGRIASYAAAGALLGFASAPLFATPAGGGGAIAALIGAAFMIVLGFYFLSGWNGLASAERLGRRFWVRIEPLGRKLLPIDRPHKAFLFGIVWGWLPCGLVYSTLAWSLACASAPRGAAAMAAFGLGTLPMLLLMGASARWLRGAANNLWARRGVGCLLILFGSYVAFGAIARGSHVH